MGYLILIVIVFALMWVLLIQPQRRRQVRHAAMLQEIEVGDEVLTVAGIYGTVRAVRADDLTLEIAPGTTVRFDKRAVASVVRPELEEGEPATDGETASNPADES
jgi:preprotein translocase subunit YajC